MLTQTHRLIWDLVLDADMNARYWRDLVRRYQRYEMLAKILLAATSSSTVAAWAIWEELRVAWQSFSGLSALVALVLPIIDFPDKAGKLANIHGRWIELHFEYERLWSKRNEIREGALEASLDELQQKTIAVSKVEAGFPYDKKLVDRCYEEVICARGLS